MVKAMMVYICTRIKHMKNDWGFDDIEDFMIEQIITDFRFFDTWYQLFNIVFKVIMSNIDWNLNGAAATYSEINSSFDPMVGWLAGKYNDSTYCVAEVFSERPPFATLKMKSDYTTNQCKKQN